MKNAHLRFGLLFLIAVILGAILGYRVDHITESEEFFKWLISASTQIRLNQSLQVTSSTDSDKETVQYKDQELFDAVKEKAERELPDLIQEDPEEAKLPKLVQYAVPPPKLVEVGKGTDLFLPDPVEQKKRLKQLWLFAKGPSLVSERKLYKEYLRNRQLASVGSQFDIDTIYGGGDISVSLTNLFFGFRKMAANLLWLESDKYWHQGEYYKMLPIMQATVKLDPNFIDAYLIGAWHLAYNATYDLQNTPPEMRRWNPRFRARVGQKESFYHEAILFLLDGISKNPTNYKLYFDLGFAIYSEKMNDMPNAVKYLSMAHRQPHDSWVPRMLYRAMMKNGQYEESLAGYMKYRDWAISQNRNVENVNRFIEYNKAYIQEREANKLFAEAKELRQEVERLRNELTQLASVDDQAARQAVETRIAQLEAQVSELETKANGHVDQARAIWKSITDREEDPLAEGKLIKLQVDELLRRDDYVEALALLDYARFKSNDLWQEFTDLIIEIKQKYGVPLNLSEQKDVFRKRIAAAYADKVVNGVTFEFRDDGWYEKTYAGQPLTVLQENTPEFNALVSSQPEIRQVLDLARLMDQYKDIADIINLGDRVIFSHNGQWYSFQAVKS